MARMTDQPVRRRRLLLVGALALAFVTGAVVGALIVSAAASRAAQVTLGGARGMFVSDQEARLAMAWNAGDMNEALAHARCAYEAKYAEGAGWFDTSAIGWSVWGGALTHAIVVTPNAANFEKARPIEEGEAHAMIAVILERLGRADEANERLARATKVGGQDPAWWRNLGLKLVGISVPQGFLHPDGTVHP
jgi:hypothetical protein